MLIAPGGEDIVLSHPEPDSSERLAGDERARARRSVGRRSEGERDAARGG
jgi:hypothetical protein